MLKSEELLNKLEEVKAEIKALQAENKIEDAHNRLHEIEDIKKEIEVAKALENEEIKDVENKIENRKDVENMEDIKVFENYIRNRGVVNTGMTQGGNGSIIPTKIADRIVEKVKEMSPILQKATVFYEGGKLVFPLEGSIPTTNYSDEFSTIPDSDATFTTVELGGYLANTLTKISESLIANANFDIVSYVVKAVAKSIATFLEKELLIGTSGKCTGALSTTNKVTTASATAITADELIDVQMLIPTALQADACWVMHTNTLKSIRKLKSTDGKYLVGDLENGFGYTVLGKPVHLSDNMPELGSEKDAVLYGDLSGLYVNFNKKIETKILNERYADQNAVGVKANFMVDSNIVEAQKLAKLTCKKSA